MEKHWAQEIEAADIVINLCGKSVNCRYNEKNKRQIIGGAANIPIWKVYTIVLRPNAVTNAGFMQTLRGITGHRIGLPAYTWMLEAGAKLIGTETELILKSRWVKPAKLLRSGFTFKYNYLQDALTDIIRKTPRSKYHLF